MSDVPAEVTHVAGLFPDGGAALLAEGGLSGGWAEVVSHVPPGLLEGRAGVEALGALRDFWWAQADLQPTLAATRALLALRRGSAGDAHPDTLLELAALGALLQRVGKVAEGGALIERAWEGMEDADAPDDLRRAVVAANLGRWRVAQGELVPAETLIARAYRIRVREAPNTAGLLAAQLGEIKQRLGRLDDALPLLQEAWVRHKETLGADDPRTGARARALGAALGQADRHSASVLPLREAVAGARAAGDRANQAAGRFLLGVALYRCEAREEGFRLVEQAIRWTRGAVGPNEEPHSELPARLAVWASMQLDRGRAAEAEGIVREAIEVERRLCGDSSAQVGELYATLGGLAARDGREDEALGFLDVAASLLLSTAGAADPRTHQVVAVLVERLLGLAEDAVSGRRRAEAREWLGRARTMGLEVLGPDDVRMRRLRELSDRAR